MMTEPREVQVRPIMAALLSAASLATLVGCGGGSELAPPVPVAEGPGMATISLGGVELGDTELVNAVVSEVDDLTVAVTDQPARFEGDPPVADLARRNLAPDIAPCGFVVEDVGLPGTFYTAGVHFAPDFNNGTLTANTDGFGGWLIPDGTDVTVSYCYLIPSITVTVGVTLPVGDEVHVTLYGLPDGASGMRSTNVTTSTRPLDGSFAFKVGAFTDLTRLNSTEYTLIDDPAQNEATVVSADLTNRLNPCIEGRVVAVMDEETTHDRVLLEVNFNDPECP